VELHGGGLVTAVDRHVVDHELAFRDDVMVIDGELVTEIVDDHRDCACRDRFAYG